MTHCESICCEKGIYKRETLLDLISRVTEVYRSEPALIKCRDPITVVGYFHDQYYDFVKLLDGDGDPVTTNTEYMFLCIFVLRENSPSYLTSAEIRSRPIRNTYSIVYMIVRKANFKYIVSGYSSCRRPAVFAVAVVPVFVPGMEYIFFCMEQIFFVPGMESIDQDGTTTRLKSLDQRNNSIWSTESLPGMEYILQQ